MFLDAVLCAVLAVHGKAVRHRDPAPPTVAPTGIIASHEPESRICFVEFLVKLVKIWLRSPTIYFQILRLFEAITIIFDLKLLS